MTRGTLKAARSSVQHRLASSLGLIPGGAALQHTMSEVGVGPAAALQLRSLRQQVIKTRSVSLMLRTACLRPRATVSSCKATWQLSAPPCRLAGPRCRVFLRHALAPHTNGSAALAAAEDTQ